MDVSPRDILANLMPPVFVLSGTILLYRSPITTFSAIKLEIESIKVFVEGVAEKNLIVGLKSFLEMFLMKFLIPEVLPLALICFGLTMAVYLYDNVRKDVLLVGMTIVLLLVAVYTRSVPATSVVLAALITSAVAIRKVDRKLASMYGYMRMVMRIFSMIALLGLAATIFLHYPKYSKFIEKENLALVNSMMGSMLKKNPAENYTIGLMNSLEKANDQIYSQISKDQRCEECAAAYHEALRKYLEESRGLVRKHSESLIPSMVHNTNSFKALCKGTPLWIYLEGMLAMEIVFLLLLAPIVPIIHEINLRVL